MYKILKLGYKFSQTWPKKEPYLQMFEQTKVIKLTDLAFTVAPAIAMATLWFQLDQLGSDYLHSSLAMALLVISLPFHGYYQLGKQAELKLPIGLQTWYRELEQKSLEEQYRHANDPFAEPSGTNSNKRNQVLQEPLPGSKKANRHLTYMDLAFLLNRIFGTTKRSRN